MDKYNAEVENYFTYQRKEMILYADDGFYYFIDEDGEVSRLCAPWKVNRAEKIKGGN